MFLCPVFSISADLAEAGSPVYTYIMSHQPSSTLWGINATWLGATHGEDITYIFGFPLTRETAEVDEGDRFPVTLTEEEVGIAQQVMRYWANFAKTG